MQHVLLIGLNHNTAPIEVRETVSFSKDQLPAALSQLNEFAKEAVIVSTCNRTEIYTVTDDITETSNLVRPSSQNFMMSRVVRSRRTCMNSPTPRPSGTC